MPHQDIAQQILLEHGMLKHLTDAVRLAVGWEMKGNDLSRKVSTVRFIAQSLQRHLEHMIGLEEHDGYMDIVVETTPHLARRVDNLRQDHNHLRQAVSRIMPRLERISHSDHAAFEKLCDELLGLVGKLEDHDKKESALIQEALARDGGGEG